MHGATIKIMFFFVKEWRIV